MFFIRQIFMFLFKWPHRVAYAPKELYVLVSRHTAQALLRLFRRRETRLFSSIVNLC